VEWSCSALKYLKLSGLHQAIVFGNTVAYFLCARSLLSGRLAMTPEDRELTNWLCTQIQEEQDPKRFSELVWQLDALLAMKDTALQNYCKPN
jgi:hypothetical protein